jgi:hypothetical protein
MNTHLKTQDSPSPRLDEGMSRNMRLALSSALVIAAFFVLREHWSHALGFLPYVLLLACPLMHLFGHHHRHEPDDARGNHARHNVGE